MAASPRLGEAGSSLAVTVVGHDGKLGHTEYLFKVRHRGGCEWMVQRRYQELWDLHERLCCVFGDLPEFPPRKTAGTVVGALFGGGAAVVATRERAFQRYFDGLCDRPDVLATQVLQVALAVAQPEPVSHLRVRGWLQPPEVWQGLSAVLEVRPEGQVAGSGAVTEAYHVVASLVFRSGSEGELEELCPVADFRVPAAGFETQVRVNGLKPGAQVEIQVSAANAVSESPEVNIRVPVPLEAPHMSPSEPPPARARLDEALAAQSSAEWFVEGSAPALSSSAPAADASAAAEDPQAMGARLSVPMTTEASALMEDLASRREELEKEYEERRREAERADAERREREAAAFKEQREELERQREVLELARSLASMNSSRAASACSGRASPRERLLAAGADTEAGDGAAVDFTLKTAGGLQARQEELERKACELREMEAEREASMEKAADEQRLEKESLEKEKEELRCQREELKVLSEAASRACERKSEELDEYEASLRRRRAEAEAEAQASEAEERASRMDDILLAQRELDEKKAELQKELDSLEESRLGQAEELREAEVLLIQRAGYVATTEQALLLERQGLQRSRQNLAVVQAHVVSLLNKVHPGSAASDGVEEHRLDDVDDEGSDGRSENGSASGYADEGGVEAVRITTKAPAVLPHGDSVDDGVWSMDWTSGFPNRKESSAPDSPSRSLVTDSPERTSGLGRVGSSGRVGSAGS
mmetsp:Transcript_175033/g.561316  ORF Transcript_175033/g.561316 Transcript_175033/m.561316 type:complete len:714 (-) Transcript_175033:19-2160(-)